MAFDLPPLSRVLKLVNPSLTASDAFARYWSEVIRAIKAAVADLVAVNNQQTELLNKILAAQALALAAQASANAANAALNSINSGFPSGTAGPLSFGVSSSSFVTIATVQLTGVTAGTLRFDTTALLSAGSATTLSAPNLSADYQITEQATSGGAVTVCLSGTWSASKITGEPVEISFPNATVDAARPAVTNVGNVTYRLQVRRSSGSGVLAGAQVVFRAGKAS